jgi:hypothetical protein
MSYKNLAIAVPVRNGRCLLAQTSDSLLAQTYPDFDLISPDNAQPI